MVNNSNSKTRTWRSLLSEHLGADVEPDMAPVTEDWDDLLRVGDHKFALLFKLRADTASIAGSLEQIQSRRKSLPRGFRPLIVVGHMGERGRELCAKAEQDWIDLAGNASITHIPRLRIVVTGRPPLQKPMQRQSNVFATKSSRVAHWLLLNPQGPHTSGAIAQATGVDKGQLSRILSRLDEMRLVRRTAEGISVPKPERLLEAWREAYVPPSKHILKGVIPSRFGEETMHLLARMMRSMGLRHAFGGLSAAWLLDGFADFRLVTCHVAGTIDPALLKEAGFLETERGANIWLMQEADEVAFMGSSTVNKVQVVSPWFAYVDLSIHPERSQEAADHLREHILMPEAIDASR